MVPKGLRKITMKDIEIACHPNDHPDDAELIYVFSILSSKWKPNFLKILIDNSQIKVWEYWPRLLRWFAIQPI